MSERAVSIRPATVSDLPTIGRLGAQLMREHHEFDPDRFIAAGEDAPREYANFLGTQLRNADAVVLVAEDQGDVVGYVYATLEGLDWMALRGPAGAIQDIAVVTERRGRGLGRQLLEAVLAHLESLGAPRVVLSTAEQNLPAQRLFASAGFRRTMVEMTRERGGGSGKA